MAKKPVEEKVPVVSVPEKKEVPAPKGRDDWYLKSLYWTSSFFADDTVFMLTTLLPGGLTIVLVQIQSVHFLTCLSLIFWVTVFECILKEPEAVKKPAAVPSPPAQKPEVPKKGT